MMQPAFVRYGTFGRQVFRIMLALCAIVALVSACVSDAPPTADPAQSVYRPPAEVRDATIVWSADPGIDLYSGQAALARAAYEAHFVGWTTHVYPTYPGYDDALIRRNGFRPEPTAHRGKNFGTMQVRMQEIRGTDTEFVAELCLLNSGLMYQAGDLYRGRRGIEYSAWEVSVKAAVDNPAWPVTEPAPAPDRMHWQAPTYDVFTGWTVEFNFSRRDTRCDPWLFSIDPTLPEKYETFDSSTPPSVLPAYPGWPSELPSSSAVSSTAPTVPR